MTVSAVFFVSKMICTEFCPYIKMLIFDKIFPNFKPFYAKILFLLLTYSQLIMYNKQSKCILLFLEI